MLKMNDKITIRCPAGTERKFPAFFRAFEGRKGRVVGDVVDNNRVFVDPIMYRHPDHEVGGWVRVDISNDPKTHLYISVDRRWLAKERAK